MEDLKYLTEAFQDLNILNEDTFDINADGLAELTSFYNDNDNDMADLETVIDPVAQTEEELQDSYIGKAILDCVICQSKIYKDPEEVIISEDGSLANVEVLQGAHALLDKEAIRVVSMSPKWQPGTQRGKAVPVSYTFPVIFQLR